MIPLSQSEARLFVCHAVLEVQTPVMMWIIRDDFAV